MTYTERIDKLKKLIDEFDYILVGAGAGLSTAAGIDYGGERFLNNFNDYKERYGIQDMYSAMFYNFNTSEESWAYRAKHVYLNRYKDGAKELYKKLFNIIKDKSYFVITTNGDYQFYLSGFDPNKIFAPQGNYSKFQCSKACHNKTYDNEETIMKMLKNWNNFKIDSSLIPKCPVCGEEMTLQLRVDNYYVEDDIYEEGYNNYVSYLSNIGNKKLLLLEFGVGYNTPGIIRYPFERLTYQNDSVNLVRFNKDFPESMKENKNKTLSFSENINKILDDTIS